MPRERERERRGKSALSCSCASRLSPLFPRRALLKRESGLPAGRESSPGFRLGGRNDGRVLPSGSKGFTLIELLVVIAIIAILAVVVILTLNPTELLKQARDSTRMSDLATLKTALGLYLTEGGSLGTPGVSYLSLPASNSNCSDLSLPSGSWACSSTSTYRNVDGTGWIPVNFGSLSIKSPLGILPVDPLNGVATFHYTYSTDGTGFLVTAAPESAKYDSQSYLSAFSAMGGSNKLIGGNFPAGWAFVPGNSAFGTPGFWVMKYEAKCVSGTTPLTSPDTGYHTYDNNSQPCTGSGYYVAATPDGYPIANVSHNTALSYCQSIGAHLLTNDEYMTIVRNAEQVSSNWSGGSPGSGYLYSGHNDNAPAYALTADSNDANGYAGETNTGGNQRRTLTLSNGSVVWDFAGNVWQHVQRSVLNAGDIVTTMALPACSNSTLGWEWCEYATNLPYVSAWSSDVVRANIGPSNASWNSSQGVGQVYTYGTGANQGTTIFIRGGNWGAGSIAGAFALDLNGGTGGTGNDVGFRCAR